jgi:hypothetical protein
MGLAMLGFQAYLVVSSEYMEKQPRRNIKRWKNCSTDDVRKNKSSSCLKNEIAAPSTIKAGGQMWTNSKVTRFHLLLKK